MGQQGEKLGAVKQQHPKVPGEPGSGQPRCWSHPSGAAQHPGSDAVPWGRWADGVGAWEMPEVVWGTWEGAQEEFVRCRDPRVVWSPLLARFEAAPSWEVGKGSTGLPDFAAMVSLLQVQGVQGNGSLKQFGTKAAAWVRDVGLVLSSSFATPTPPHRGELVHAAALLLRGYRW